MIHCYIGLGSNLHSPIRQLHQAIQHLKCLPSTHIIKLSPLYLSEPMGKRGQPAYCNMAALLSTRLPPFKLLHYCHLIENKQQRVRKSKWGPRTVDIDLLLYANQRYHSPALQIPHPALLHRDFVLVPLLAINNELTLPNGEKPRDYLKTCGAFLKKQVRC